MDSDYPFESLGPDRFQRLCQVLVSTEFSDTQAFPLRQPDGGRDSVAYTWDGDRRAMVVFQVKFVENPNSIKEPHKWLLEVMEDEAPKIAELLPKGAESYCLITNVRGTGHAEKGSIDKLDDTLKKALKIPFRCWWRDDLVVRTKKDRDLRWDFPELLAGIDVLRDIVESDLSEQRKRRASAIKAYLTEQYEEDKQVRFKQVELQNELLGLFVDIPVSISSVGKHESERVRDAAVLLPIWRRLQGLAEDASSAQRALQEATRFADPDMRLDYPTSDLLLDAEFQEHLPLVVLEGAPGQGKSTITQYLCQVHRMRLLNKQKSRLTERHNNSPLRVPFRVDLRDLARWFQGKDPFNPDQELPGAQPRSVEGFLAASVSHNSGGVTFDVADLLAVLEVSAAVAVFDGLDEVADIDTRKRLVEELTSTARRLGSTALSFQMVITSRPAAFAKSPGFDPKTFRYLALEAITPDIATAYSEKWISAKELVKRDAAEVRRVLETKLREPHMRELARNTMQLTILLSLIYARGSSLPDKRTALYTAYIDTFLNRESEKSEIVRKHRDLLLNLHGHLAWILHKEAEKGSGSGRIGRDELMTVLKGYLEKEGHDTELVDQLFEGVVARVFVLVSRVEGVYEFEVQPLREYFAGRYLYDTAPYSPTGAEVGGTLTDRFQALARNPYWLNVARFYAGCFSKGEIPSLVESLKDMTEDPEFEVLNQPRVLASMLLSDWVFSQNPRSLDEVVEIMADPLGIQVMTGDARFRLREAIDILPEGSGRRELVDHCFTQLEKSSNLSYSRGLSTVIRRNGSAKEIKNRWLQLTKDASGAARTRWMDFGRSLGAIEEASDSDLDDLLGHPPSESELMVLLASRGRYLASDELRAKLTVDAILAGHSSYLTTDDKQTVLNGFALTYALTPHRLFELDRLYRHSRTPFHAELSELESPLLLKCADVVSVWGEQSMGDQDSWFVSLRPWEKLIERSRELFGERWAHSVLAVEASGIRSPSETYPEASDLFDNDVSLARRARYARLRAGNPKWWGEQLDRAKTGDDRLLVLAIMLSRASERTISAQIERLDTLLRKISADEFGRLWVTCNRARSFDAQFGADRRTFEDSMQLPRDLSERTIAVLGPRASTGLRRHLYQRYLRSYKGRRIQLLDLAIEAELVGQKSNTRVWKRVIPMLRRYPGRYLVRPGMPIHEMPLQIAREICLDPSGFDSELVFRAEKRCNSATEFEPVAKVAAKQAWFPST
jgi:hypothetical protein